MLHLTINTGHVRHSPRSEVSDDAVAVCRTLISPGRHPVPGIPGGYSLAVTRDGGSLLTTVYAEGMRPCVTFGVAADDAAAATLWPVLQSHYHSLTDLPGMRSADFAAASQPESAPWCAAITIMMRPDEGLWIGDFERCVAWAFLEHFVSE